MKLTGNMLTVCHDVKEPGRGVLGMAGHKAYPEFSRNPVNLFQQIREMIVCIQIIAVGVDILAQKGNFLVSGLYQLPDLRKDRRGFPAALPAPDVGNNAVGTEIIASVHDGNPSLHAPFPHHRDSAMPPCSSAVEKTRFRVS